MKKDKNFDDNDDNTYIPKEIAKADTFIDKNDNVSDATAKPNSGYEKTVNETFIETGKNLKEEVKVKKGSGYEKTIDSEFDSGQKQAEAGDSSYFGKSTSGQKITFENLAFISNEERYEVKRMLGKGGMGVVMLVRDNILEREVAMKLIKSESSKTSSYYRFIQEARITGVLEHPNIIPVYDLSCLDDLYFTMRLVDGYTFSDIISGIKQNDEEYQEYSLVKRLQIMLSVCYAIEFAHSKDIIHRDLKPDNIMIGKFGQVLVLDWGLAKYIGSEEKEEQNNTSNILPDATGSGSLVGTPRYMAPEQAQGQVQNIDKFTDVYALGAILYEVITLEPVFKAADLISLIDMIVNKPAENKRYNVKNEIIPRELMSIATKALAKEKHDRYLSVSQLRKDIERYMEGRSVKAAPDNWYGKIEKLIVRNLAVSIVIFIAILLVGVFYHFFSVNQSIAEVENKIFLNNLTTQIESNSYLYNKTVTKKHEYLQKLRQNLTQSETTELKIELAKIEKEMEFYGNTVRSTCENVLRIEKNHPAAHILANYYIKNAEDIILSQNYKMFAEARLEIEKAILLSPSVKEIAENIKTKLSAEGKVNINKLCSQNIHLYKINNGNEPFSLEHLQEITDSKQITLSLGSYVIKNPDRNYSFPFIVQPNSEIKLPIYNTKNFPDNSIFIPEGSFYVGTDNFLDEYQKRINVKSFYIEKTEVTLGEYLKFYHAMSQEKYIPKILLSSSYENLWDENENLKFGLTPDCPVFGITFHAAEDFCTWKQKVTGIAYSLPLENEWEKAARGVDGRFFPWGNQSENSWAAVQKNKSFSKVSPVANFEIDTSIYGAMDMAGNVAEWTTTSTTENLYIVKGAHCNDNIENAKAYLSSSLPADYIGYIGFRCVVRSVYLEGKK